MAGRTAIGLDIGTSGVRAAELSFGKNGVTLERFGQVAVPEGAVRDGEVVDASAVAHAVRQLWSATRFSHKNVVLGIANQRVIVRHVELPWLPPAELRSSLPFQVQEFMPIPVDQAELDFLPLGESGGDGSPRMVSGLLVAASREMVLSNVRAVESAGLRATMVDLTSFAVLRSMAQTDGIAGDTEAIVDIGARVTNIVVHSGGSPRFVRILLMGGQDITDTLADRLGMAQEQAELLKQELGSGQHNEDAVTATRAIEMTAAAFIDEVRGSLDYFAASSPGLAPSRLVVSGGGSRLRGLPERLAAATRLPVVVGDPLESLNIGRTGLSAEQLSYVRPLAAVPVGLALGAAS